MHLQIFEGGGGLSVGALSLHPRQLFFQTSFTWRGRFSSVFELMLQTIERTLKIECSWMSVCVRSNFPPLYKTYWAYSQGHIKQNYWTHKVKYPELSALFKWLFITLMDLLRWRILFLNSQMNPLETLIEAIKNGIFIFRLGGLTRTATVSYYSTQDGGLALLDVCEVLHCGNQITTSLRDNNTCSCILLIKKKSQISE